VNRALLAIVAAVAAVAAGLLIADEGADPAADRPVPPAARVTSTEGSFTRAANPDGMPVFSARDLSPGDSANGSVRVANRGSRRGYFYLTQSELTDLPGEGGGALSPILRMTVLDVTDPAKPATVYDGDFGAMDARPLGFFAPGETRSYSFTARLPERRVQPELYVESAVRARYVWSPLGDAPRRDRRPPKVGLTISPVQRILERGYLEAEARCAEECRLSAQGSVAVGGGEPRPAPPIRDRRVDRGEPANLRVRLSKRDLRALPDALLAGDPARIRVIVGARDLAGNAATVKRTIRLRRKR
jgi:hypothetical protein